LSELRFHSLNQMVAHGIQFHCHPYKRTWDQKLFLNHLYERASLTRPRQVGNEEEPKMQISTQQLPKRYFTILCVIQQHLPAFVWKTTPGWSRCSPFWRCSSTAHLSLRVALGASCTTSPETSLLLVFDDHWLLLLSAYLGFFLAESADAAQDTASAAAEDADPEQNPQSQNPPGSEASAAHNRCTFNCKEKYQKAWILCFGSKRLCRCDREQCTFFVCSFR